MQFRCSRYICPEIHAISEAKTVLSPAGHSLPTHRLHRVEAKGELVQGVKHATNCNRHQAVIHMFDMNSATHNSHEPIQHLLPW